MRGETGGAFAETRGQEGYVRGARREVGVEVIESRPLRVDSDEERLGEEAVSFGDLLLEEEAEGVGDSIVQVVLEGRSGLAQLVKVSLVLSCGEFLAASCKKKSGTFIHGIRCLGSSA